MTTTSTLQKILTLSDRHMPVADIATELDVTLGYVYGLLREHRPKRKRKKHKLRSDLPRMIRGLAKDGHAQARIAVVLGVTRQYVSQVLTR